MVLEVASIADDVQEFGRVFDGEIIAYAVSFIADSFKNTIQAFIWPVFVVQIAPPYGAIGLGLVFWLFPLYLKKPIENWMFDGQPPPAKDERDAK